MRARTLLRLVYIYRGKARKKKSKNTPTTPTAAELPPPYYGRYRALLTFLELLLWASIEATTATDKVPQRTGLIGLSPTRSCSPLTRFWSRLVHADLAMHAILAALCSGRDSFMLTSRCMLPWLRSAPYPALCPCEPLVPVGDMQAVSYGARSRRYSPLLPASSS